MQRGGQDSAVPLLTARRVATLAGNRRADERDIRHEVIRAAGGRRWKRNTTSTSSSFTLLSPFARGHACFHLDISVIELAWHLVPHEASVFVCVGGWRGTGSGQDRPSQLVRSSLSCTHVEEQLEVMTRNAAAD